MDRLVYTALTGLQRAQESQSVTAHNLANAATPGFRREMAALGAGFLTPSGAALTARAQSGGESPHDLLNPGRVESTGNALDVAMDGGAWLAVADSGGGEALTRRGDLRIDPEGRLLTGDGHAVMGEDGPIAIATGFQSLRIGRDGALETRASDDAPFVEVARLKLVTPDPATLARGADGLFRAPAMETDETATVTVGAIERSNVETAAALVELVEQSRRFELQTKLITTARDMDEASASLMRVQ
ncbi:flagellar hook-basal body complex protein [Sandaracinobacter neustonicus]|uniref:Flagellar basal-body rod protein FlgF n=1 Tax=Sandaracinobacter neustonicus TaxID=1715348 RepID=A0A501XES2_9SPHN|nr:flagellar basal body rod protein FlgF [Sandaracinobacter neustonicus]TPE59010.1 flagellar hook-basal body complex protein [Sandaracinobacter neustonicus]